MLFFRRSLGSTRVLNPVKIWDFEMTDERIIKLNLPETDSLCVRSVCRNPQVTKKSFAHQKKKNSLFSFQGKTFNWFKNIGYIRNR